MLYLASTYAAVNETEIDKPEVSKQDKYCPLCCSEFWKTMEMQRYTRTEQSGWMYCCTVSLRPCFKGHLLIPGFQSLHPSEGKSRRLALTSETWIKDGVMNRTNGTLNFNCILTNCLERQKTKQNKNKQKTQTCKQLFVHKCLQVKLRPLKSAIVCPLKVP